MLSVLQVDRIPPWPRLMVLATALLVPLTLAAVEAAPGWSASATSSRVITRVLHIAPSMSAAPAHLELDYLDRQYARSEPSLISWHVSDCRRRSRTADNVASATSSHRGATA